MTNRIILLLQMRHEPLKSLEDLHLEDSRDGDVL